jgi:hypothetical protein
MARRRGNKKPVNNNKKDQSQIRKKGQGSDLKPTRCSLCRFAKDARGNECYARSRFLPELEKIDCIPAYIHYSDYALVCAGLIKREGS